MKTNIAGPMILLILVSWLGSSTTEVLGGMITLRILPTLLVYKNATEIDLMCCTSIGSFGDLMVTSNMAAVQFSGYLPKWNSTCIRGNITLIDSSGQCLLNISCKQYNNSQLDIVSLQIESANCSFSAMSANILEVVIPVVIISIAIVIIIIISGCFAYCCIKKYCAKRCRQQPSRV